MTSVNVIGLGYIGLPTALTMAAHGLQVVGTDINRSVIEALSAHELTFEEKGLDDLFERALAEGIEFSVSPVAAEFYIVALPTPFDEATKKIDASLVVAGVRSAVEVCPDDAVLIVESTISPGTVDQFVRPVVEEASARRGVRIHVCHAPERIIPGNMLHELKTNARTIGADTPEVAARVAAIYATFCEGEIVLTDVRSAEMSKVVENTFRDINIAFANELALICSKAGLDVYEIIRLANLHPRVNILLPGPGVGGHCIPVDPWFLVGDFPDEAQLIHRARLTNDAMPGHVLRRIGQVMKAEGLTDASRVGIYGLAYKENVDDVRESPSLQLLEVMEEHLAPTPLSYDPHCKAGTVDRQAASLREFLDAVDLVVVMTGHSEVRAPGALDGKVVLDTRNCVSGQRVHRL